MTDHPLHPRIRDRVSSRLMLAFAVFGLLVMALMALALLTGDHLRGNDSRDFLRLAAVFTLAALPIQCFSLWSVSHGHIADQTHHKRLRNRIDRVIANDEMRIVFQPILDSQSLDVVGVEALSRFDATPQAGPDVWFAKADTVGRQLELELMAIRKALRDAASLPSGLYIAINVSPNTFRSAALLPALLNGGIQPDRLVLEITEHASIEDYAPLQEMRAQLPALGIRLAVDDAGSGYASFRHIVALSPDIIKIDRGIVAGVDRDSARSALVASVVSFARSANMTTVAEGVETTHELLHLKALGVHGIQGHLISAPTRRPEDWSHWASATATQVF